MMGLELEKIHHWLFVGVLPPPFGGVTIFAKRIVATWRAQGKSVSVLDLIRSSRLQKFQHLVKLLFASKQWGIYVNDLSGVGLMGAAFNFRGASIFFHDHNYDLSPMKGFRAFALKRCLSKCTMVFFDGLHSRHNYISRGHLNESQVFRFSSPFIPQDLSEQAAIVARYPVELKRFIAEHSPLLSANAFKVIVTDTGVDLYGLDMCIALLAAVRERSPTAGFVFALSDNTESDHLKTMRRMLHAMGLNGHFFFFSSKEEVWPLFQQSDVMVRPTSTDGFGISIAEALHAGTPAVASDVCVRPVGTIMFKSRNQTDLNRKVFEVLKLNN